MQDYTYYFVPAPWLCVKLMKLLQCFPMPSKWPACIFTCMLQPPHVTLSSAIYTMDSFIFHAAHTIAHTLSRCFLDGVVCSWCHSESKTEWGYWCCLEESVGKYILSRSVCAIQNMFSMCYPKHVQYVPSKAWCVCVCECVCMWVCECVPVISCFLFVGPKQVTQNTAFQCQECGFVWDCQPYCTLWLVSVLNVIYVVLCWMGRNGFNTW